MAELYSFFDSVEGDIREYTSAEFAAFFSKFLSDGVYTKNNKMGLEVTMQGLNINVGVGSAFIRGYLYMNDSDLSMTIKKADNVLDRIDRLVLKLDITNRRINLKVKEGSMGSQPKPPDLINSAGVKELPIAQIRMNKGQSTGIITDERLPVSSLIEIPFEDMAAEFNEWFEQVKIDLEESEIKSLIRGLEDIVAGLSDDVDKIPKLFTGYQEPVGIRAGDHWLKELR